MRISMLFCGDLTIHYLGLAYHCYFYVKNSNYCLSSNSHRTAILFNIYELEDTIRELINIGADSICVKYDITGNESVAHQNECQQIISHCKAIYENDNFKVLVMHDEAPDRDKGRWNCSQGCYYRYFFCTIGSDGNVYPCDYQTLTDCPQFGNLIEMSFEETYKRKKTEWNSMVINKRNFKNVCPPLAEVINPYLTTLSELIECYGSEIVLLAIEDIRRNYK